MSSGGAGAVLGVIASILTIIDGSKQIYEATKHAQGLPAAFRDVADRLPVVKDILDSARLAINEGTVDEKTCKGLKPVVDSCERKATKLDELFRNVSPANGTSDVRRYYKAVKAYGKGSEVESLMKGMLEDIQLLACEHGMKTANDHQQEQILQAIAEVSAIPPSVPEHVFQEPGFTANYSGSGQQWNAQGEYVAQGTSRQYNSAGGTMTFGRDKGSEE